MDICTIYRMHTEGKKIYEKLKERGWLFIFNGNIGEVVFTCAYIPAFKKKNNIRNCVAVTYEKLNCLLRFTYPFFDDVIILDKKRLNNLCFYLRYKKFYRTKAVNSIWHDKRMRYSADNKGVFPIDKYKTSRCYASYLGLDILTDIVHPVEQNNELIYKKYMNYRIETNRSILLLPEANTCKTFDSLFWIELATRLEKKGYRVIFNCDSNYDTGGYEIIHPDLSDISSLVKWGGIVFPLRVAYPIC